MPFYDFRCRTCGKEFNLLASVTQMSAKSIPCPACAGKNLEVLIKGGSAVIVKGAQDDCPHAQSCGCQGNCPHSH